MGKALGTILKVGAAIAMVASVAATAGASLGLIAAGGTLFGLGVSAATLTLVATGLTLGSSLLSQKPKAPAASPASTDRLVASINARAPRKIWLGSTAGATDIQDQEFTDGQTYLHRFIVLASHKVHAVDEVWFDDKLAWTSGDGAQGEFAGYLTITPILEGSAGNAINISARMGATRRYTGCAYLHVRYKLTGSSKNAESPFAQAIPSRVTVRGDGAFVYDPRLDDTAGGDGDQRADNQTTWAWSDSASRNPALQLLWFLLGWRIQNPVSSAWKLAVGKGIPPDRIDLESFITAANLCDEAVARSAGGTEPRYRSDGVFSEADDPGLVLDNLKASMNAVLDDVDGKIRITVLHNDLATPQAELTTDDVLGEFKWSQTPPLPSTFNVIRGSYTDPSNASLYQSIDYPEVRLLSPDGIDRIETVDLPLVQSASQAQRLVKQRLQRQQYGGTFQAVFQATAWRYLKGDVVPFTFAPLGWTGKLFRIVDIEVRVDGTVPMTLREEGADIYQWDADDAAPVLGAAPTSYNYTLNPIYLDLSELGDAIVGVLDDLSSLADDGNLTRFEKITKLIPLDAQLEGQYDILQLQVPPLSGNIGVVAAAADAEDAWDAWVAYRNSLDPAWNDTSEDTAVVRATYDGKVNDLRLALDTLASALRAATEDLANEALTAAEAAAGLANGKSTLFYQSTPPTASESAENDRWLDTDDGNFEYRRLPGNGFLEFDGDPMTFGGDPLEIAPWAPAPDQRIGRALVDAAGAQATADRKIETFKQEDEPTADGIGDLWYKPSTGVMKRWDGDSWEETADNTALVQPIIRGATPVIFNADYLGALNSGQAPRDVPYRRFQGETDVTSSTAWSISSSDGVSVSIGSSDGVANITAVSKDAASFVIQSTYGGVTRDYTVMVQRVKSAPPVSTGGGGGGGNPGTTGTTDVSAATTATTYGSADSGSFTCVAGTAGQVALAATLNVSLYATGGVFSQSGYAKWQWRAIGGSYADVGSEIASNGPAIYDKFDGPQDTTLDANVTKTGLTSGTSYEFRLTYRKDSGSSGQTMSFSGTGVGIGS